MNNIKLNFFYSLLYSNKTIKSLRYSSKICVSLNLQINLLANCQICSKVNQELKSEAITNMQELISVFEDNGLSTFHKMRIYYINTDKFKIYCYFVYC